MERETELTQSWNPELAAALNDKGGLLNGIPLLVGGELKTFSLPVPLDDDGTDISLKDWQLGPRNSFDREAAAPYSIKPFKGSVRTRFTPMEPRLDEDLSPRGQSSPDHFETPTTPRTPRTSSSGTRSSSVSPSKSFLQEGDQTLLATLQSDLSSTHTAGSESNNSLRSIDSDGNQTHHVLQNTTPSPRSGGIAFDVTLDDQTLGNSNADTNNKSARSLRVSFVENSQMPHRSSAPVVRHRSPLKSRSLHPPKEVKALQPKWESSTKIRHPISTSSSVTTPVTKPHVHAPAHGVRRKSTPGAKPRATVAPLPMPTQEIETEFQGSSGYLSEGRALGSDRLSGRDLRRSLDSQSMGYSRGYYGENSSNHLSSHVSRDLTMSPIRDFSAPNSHPGLARSFGRKHGGRYEVEDDDEEDTKVGMLCGGGLSDTKLSGDFVRLLSKLCRVSVPAPKQPLPKSASRGRKFERSNTTSLSLDSATQSPAKETFPVIGRHHSLKLLSEKCSNAPTPTYDVNKPRKIRDHEPHIHFYKTISKTLDRKLKYFTYYFSSFSDFHLNLMS
ncbi:hypothetical protein M758_9G091000 [Ceratodon purpureus]|nr:hypothetical protein M758_9G091000 [Ceratodon purpureus]